MALDRTRPWGEEHTGGVYPVLIQDGRRFRYNGEPVDEDPPSEVVVLADADENGALEDMHWTAIRQLVETYGGTYRDKQSGIAYIKGLLTE